MEVGMANRALLMLVVLLCSPLIDSASAQIQQLTECPIGTLFADTAPEQVHIQSTGDPTEMLVVWATPGQTDSEVEYGEGESLDRSVEGEEECYDHNMVFHFATMVDLNPATEYSYRVGDGDQWSTLLTFRTAAPSANTFEFIAFGDHGMSSDAQATFDNMQTFTEVELVILAGDISYANGDQAIWDDHANQYQDSMASIPWMVAPGNHENENGYDFDAYQTRFEMPSSSGTDLWHSFEQGGVHFIAISTEHDYTAGSEQLEWFAADLAAAAANRENVPWIVVYGHKPAYTTHGGSDSHDGQREEIRGIFEPFLVDHQVDLVIWGHEHFYERTWPVVNATVQQRGVDEEGYMFSGYHAPIHITAGTGGRGSYTPEDDEAEWTFHREVSHGLLHITVDRKAGSMHVEYVRNDGEVGDAFLLLKERIVAVEPEGKGLPTPGMSLVLLSMLAAAYSRRAQSRRTSKSLEEW